ncbi:acetylglutamate kinase [Tumebacillus avium]|uniref:Acetylglutamate kinase n=1 Tax=Tumebacillus avium TaxID=1903704 RepID=A0A1Y0IKU4_9BACL|nr:acetylglutamate kinase [Tumebacillus avium]ARU61122.1 acetylglutamate kinase [Tumebacillus avium]
MMTMTQTETLTPAEKAHVLLEALPYIQKFAGKIVVIKYGGSSIEPDSGEIDPVILDIIWLKQVGLYPVVVHGGGKAINRLLERLGHQAQFIDGLRVTDEPTLEAVEMVLGGLVNQQLVAAFHAGGCKAVGLTGVDGGLLAAQKITHEKGDLGRVGEVMAVHAEPIHALLQNGFLPVIAPLGCDEQGARYNINADSAAGAIAAALGAEKLILLTDVPGILQAGELINQVTPEEVDALLADGTIQGGMVPKVEACLAALHGGAQQVHILNGKEPHALLLEIFTERGVGTLVHR